MKLGYVQVLSFEKQLLHISVALLLNHSQCSIAWCYITVLASFCSFFVSHVMYCIIFEKALSIYFEHLLASSFVTFCLCFLSSVFNTTLSHGARAVDAIKTFEEVVVLGNQSLETSEQVNKSLQEIMNRVR